MKCTHVYIDPKTKAQYNCGKCPACRANYASQWKLRCLYELDDWDKAIFVTLTYSDEWLLTHNMSKQGFATLRKKDVQDFIKRIRADIDYSEKGREIKYYFCGEYSPKWRPHYHGIIFGLDRYDEKDRKYIVDNWCPPNALRCEPWQFDLKRGDKDGIQDVTPESIGYCTDYANKNLFGQYAKVEYQDKGREKPFKINSQGLGLNFAMKNADRLREHGYTCVTNGKKIGIPRYFREKLDIDIKTDVKSSKKGQILRDNAYLREQFEKDTGLSVKDTNLTWYEHSFQNWYDNYRWCYANTIFEQYQLRQKLIHKEKY